MEDFLQLQTRESCKLALPNGLQDLMTDISREVLRAQPNNVCQFIADYLSALLVARENMSVAARVCDKVCNAQCWPELEDELRDIGLSDEDIKETVAIVTKFFERGKVEEGNLLLRLLEKTEVEETQLPDVLAAVRRAFLAHKLNTDLPCDSSSTDSDLNETTRAVQHTMKLYRQTVHTGKDYSIAAEKIQAAYRAYRVRRQMRDRADASKQHADNYEKSIRFKPQMQRLFPESSTEPRNSCASKASSMSLAGSFITLPRFTPYSNNYSDIVEQEDVAETETERTTIDYTGCRADRTEAAEITKQRDRKKSISFHELDEILYSTCDETSEAADTTKNIQEKETNHEITNDEDVKLDFYPKNETAIEIGGENSKEVMHNEIIDEMYPETIGEDAGVQEEMVHYEASSLEGDIEEEIPNEEASVEDIDNIEKVMSLMNHDEVTENDYEPGFMMDTIVFDESDDDNDDSPDFYSNKDFDYESSKETNTD